MINRRRVIRVALTACLAVSLATLPVIWLGSSAAHAEQAFERFVPLLVDLDGWQGKKPQDVAMEMTGTSMISASREYDRGPAHL